MDIEKDPQVFCKNSMHSIAKLSLHPPKVWLFCFIFKDKILYLLILDAIHSPCVIIFLYFTIFFCKDIWIIVLKHVFKSCVWAENISQQVKFHIKAKICEDLTSNSLYKHISWTHGTRTHNPKCFLERWKVDKKVLKGYGPDSLVYTGEK